MIAQLCKVIALAGLALALTACSTTPPSTHYLLTATLEQLPAGGEPALGIGPIEIPEYLNRNTIVYRGQDNELKIDHQSRWGEPLEDGVSRVVSLNLAGLLGTESVRSFPWHPKRPPDYGIRIRILRLDATASEAVLVAEWVIYRPDSAQEAQREISRHSLSLDSTQPIPGQLPVAHSTLLYQLSEDIAAAVTAEQQAAP